MYKTIFIDRRKEFEATIWHGGIEPVYKKSDVFAKNIITQITIASKTNLFFHLLCISMLKDHGTSDFKHPPIEVVVYEIDEGIIINYY